VRARRTRRGRSDIGDDTDDAQRRAGVRVSTSDDRGTEQENTVVSAAMPMATDTTAVSAKSGARRKLRSA
jgi:hypothetical protein